MIKELLSLCRERQASDLHLVRGEPPVLRIFGTLHRTELPLMIDSELDSLLLSLMSDSQRAHFEEFSDIDFSFALPDTDRFRVNIHRQRGAVEGAFRRLPSAIPSLKDLGHPMATGDLARLSNGLVLITGPVGMGKSTTLAAMIDQINHERACLIVSIEDPIEYMHNNHHSIIKQREVSIDTPSFEMALKHALRQDPNVLVIGEMRDLETISIALTAAETGHLVLATLHTPDAAQSIQRIIDVFPPYKQSQVRIQLADSLQGIVAHQLLPKAGGQGMVLAVEILIATPAVRNLIRESSVEQIPNIVQTSAKLGMRSMDRSLRELVDRRLITREAAISRAKYREDFDLSAVK